MPSSTQTQRPLAPTTEVAAFLGVPEKTLIKWRYFGTGPSYSRIGKHVRYSWTDVEAWVEQMKASPRPAAEMGR